MRDTQHSLEIDHCDLRTTALSIKNTVGIVDSPPSPMVSEVDMHQLECVFLV